MVGMGRRGEFGLTTHSVADNKARECGAILRGAKAAGLQGVCHGVHPGQPAGRLYGVSEGACGALRLWPFCQQGAGMSIKPGYTRPLDLKHGRVDMTHGSGGGRWRS